MRKQTKLKINVNSTAVLDDENNFFTFLAGDNLLLLDICSCFLVLIRVLSYLKSFLFRVNQKSLIWRGEVDSKMWG